MARWCLGAARFAPSTSNTSSPAGSSAQDRSTRGVNGSNGCLRCVCGDAAGRLLVPADGSDGRLPWPVQALARKYLPSLLLAGRANHLRRARRGGAPRVDVALHRCCGRQGRKQARHTGGVGLVGAWITPHLFPHLRGFSPRPPAVAAFSLRDVRAPASTRTA